eukprot:jgi/Chrzof1/14275/Cz08g31270.t1
MFITIVINADDDNVNMILTPREQLDELLRPYRTFLVQALRDLVWHHDYGRLAALASRLSRRVPPAPGRMFGVTTVMGVPHDRGIPTVVTGPLMIYRYD